MSSEVLAEEFEVLEAIYPGELSKLSERAIRIDVAPDEEIEGEDEIKLTLELQYPDGYPDVLPELSLDVLEGEVDDRETEELLDGMQAVGEENLGIAMTFTLVTHLKEKLLAMIQQRVQRRKDEELERERQALEAEEARTRGTPVSTESFKAWKTKFDKEMGARKAREEEERLRGLTAKEREEYKRAQTRLTGRQLFERNKYLDDESLVDEEAVSVDISQYERTTAVEEEEEDKVVFSDSD